MGQKYSSTELYGQCTDKTRRLLIAIGWVYDSSCFLWQDPQSRKWYTEPEATVIMKSRIRSYTHPEDRIDPYMRRHGRPK